MNRRPKTSAILAQALGSVFVEMNRTAAFWQRIQRISGGSSVSDLVSSSCRAGASGSESHDAVFGLGYQIQEIYRLILPPATLMELKRMCLYPAETFHFDDMVWARVVYDFALAWRMRVMDRDHLMER